MKNDQDQTPSHEDPLHPSSLIPHTFSSAVAVYYWHGARPLLFDLPADHLGWLLCLSFRRDGDICFVPLAWDHQQYTDDDIRTQITPLPHPSPHSQSQQQQSIDHTINNLQQEGWHLHGRFTIHFTGQDTAPNFHQQTNTYLWQQPVKR